MKDSACSAWGSASQQVIPGGHWQGSSWRHSAPAAQGRAAGMNWTPYHHHGSAQRSWNQRQSVPSPRQCLRQPRKPARMLNCIRPCSPKGWPVRHLTLCANESLTARARKPSVPQGQAGLPYRWAERGRIAMTISRLAHACQHPCWLQHQWIGTGSAQLAKDIPTIEHSSAHSYDLCRTEWPWQHPNIPGSRVCSLSHAQQSMGAPTSYQPTSLEGVRCGPVEAGSEQPGQCHNACIMVVGGYR